MGAYDWQSFPNIYDNYKGADPRLWALTQIKKKGLRDFGAALSPEAAHELAIGAETLALRLERQCANAQAVAEFLDGPQRGAPGLLPRLAAASGVRSRRTAVPGIRVPC